MIDFISQYLLGSSYGLYNMGLLRWLSCKESACQRRRYGFDPWVRKIPWRRKWQPTPVFLSRKSQGQRSLVGYSQWGHKESYMSEHAHMYTHTHTQYNISIMISVTFGMCSPGYFIRPQSKTQVPCGKHMCNKNTTIKLILMTQ